MKIIVLDTETTGIPDRDPLARIIEVGAVAAEWSGGSIEIVDTFESLCNPGRLFYDRPTCAKALEVNGLTHDDIRQSPPAYVVGRELRRWLASQYPDAMTAYGVEFDFDPLLLGAPEWLGPVMPIVPIAPCIRTLARQANGLDVYDRGYKLSDMMGRYKIEREGDAHTALSDAIGAARIIPHVYPATLDLCAEQPVTTARTLTREQLRRITP